MVQLIEGPDGKEYESIIGSRVQVKRGKAYKTSGGLRAKDIVVNKHGRYVSKRLSELGKKHGADRLAKAGYGLFKPGAVGQVTRVTKRKGSKGSKGTKKRRAT